MTISSATSAIGAGAAAISTMAPLAADFITTAAPAVNVLILESLLSEPVVVRK